MKSNKKNDKYKKKSDLYRILLSHHPNCEKYKNHTFKIGKINFCIGCFLGYPAGIIAIIFGYNAYENQHLSENSLLIIGLSLLIPIGLSLFSISEIKWVKIIQKITTGFGGALVLLYVYLSTTGSVFVKLIEVWGMCVIIMAPLTILHYLKFKKTCLICELDYIENVCPFIKNERDSPIESNKENLN